jgi:hypothetical protein
MLSGGVIAMTRRAALGSHILYVNGVTVEAKSGHFDITGAAWAELQISGDGAVIWVNTDKGNVLRVCQIKGEISILDQRSSAGLPKRPRRRRKTS